MLSSHCVVPGEHTQVIRLGGKYIHPLFISLVLLLFLRRVSKDWPGTHGNPPVSTSQMLGWQVQVITPHLMPFHLSQLPPSSSQPSLENDPLSSMVLMRKLRHRKGPESHTEPTWEPGLEPSVQPPQHTKRCIGERLAADVVKDPGRGGAEWQALLRRQHLDSRQGHPQSPVPSPLVQDSLPVHFSAIAGASPAHSRKSCHCYFGKVDNFFFFLILRRA